MSTKDTEREHCEAVARRFTSAHTIGEITDDLAGVILRERAAARDQALEEATAAVQVVVAVFVNREAACERIRALKGGGR